MDRHTAYAEVFSSERGDKVIGTVGPWSYQELQLTHEKIEWLWTQIRDMRSLFSDLTTGHKEKFYSVLGDPYSYWLEVINQDDAIIGFMYMTKMDQGIDADIHLLFLDRRPHEKAELCKEMIEHIFNKFPSLHRITAIIPYRYHATVRLARKIGFRQEGVKRETFLLGHRWLDEIHFGLLSTEVFHGLV